MNYIYYQIHIYNKYQLDSKIEVMKKELPPSRTADQYVLRFPDGMRDRIAEIAKTNGRSMNSEIIARLQTSFELPENTSSSEMLLEMRRTQLHLELNTASSQLGYLFARGQEVKAAITRLEVEKASPEKIEEAKTAIANISKRKKVLDIQMANALGRLAELELRIKEIKGEK